MSCDNCEWEDAITRAHDAADSLPRWKTNRIELLHDIGSTVEEKEHITPRQIEVIENAENEIGE